MGHLMGHGSMGHKCDGSMGHLMGHGSMGHKCDGSDGSWVTDVDPWSTLIGTLTIISNYRLQPITLQQGMKGSRTD